MRGFWSLCFTWQLLVASKSKETLLCNAMTQSNRLVKVILCSLMMARCHQLVHRQWPPVVACQVQCIWELGLYIVLTATVSQGMELSLAACLLCRSTPAVASASSTVVAIDHHSLKGKFVFVFALINIVLIARIYLWLPYRILNTESTLITMTIVTVGLNKH